MFGLCHVQRIILLLVVVLCRPSPCADIVFFRSAQGSAAEQQQLEIATEFYGLNLNTLVIGDGRSNASMSATLNRKETVAVAVAADALGLVSLKVRQQIQTRQRAKGELPLLVLGVMPGQDMNLIGEWTNGAVTGC